MKYPLSIEVYTCICTHSLMFESPPSRILNLDRVFRRTESKTFIGQDDDGLGTHWYFEGPGISYAQPGEMRDRERGQMGKVCFGNQETN